MIRKVLLMMMVVVLMKMILLNMMVMIFPNREVGGRSTAGLTHTAIGADLSPYSLPV